MDKIAPAPIIGRGAREYRNDLKDLRKSAYVVTARYEDGSYGLVETEQEPDLRKGDRVRLRQGVLERLP